MGRPIELLLLSWLATVAFTFCVIGASPTSAEVAGSSESLRADIDERLSSSLTELSQTRNRIAKEKIPVSRAIFELEGEVLGLRRQQQQLLRLRDSRSVDLTTLRKQVASLEEQDEFVTSRLNEFIRDFEGRLDISELARYEELTAAAKLSEQNINLDAGEKRSTQLVVVRAALERLEAQLGGEIYSGDALGPDGVLRSGRFVSFGPTVFYASDDETVIGLVETQLNAADPVVVELPGSYERQIVELAATSSGELPFDATLGKALKKERARKGVLAHIQDGGVVGYVILVLGVSAALLAGFKVREIIRFEVAGVDAVDGILDDLTKGNEEAAIWRASKIEGISGEMLQAGVEHSHEKRQLLEEILFEKILRVRPLLERFLPFLSITAGAAPLLGLLGTVVGMIKTFQLITIFGTGDAKSLSSGISEALVTTALGLIVAIPVLIVHGALARMAKRKIGMLEQLSVAFVNGVSAMRHSQENHKRD